MSSTRPVRRWTRGCNRRRGVVLIATVLCVGLLSACVPRPPGDFYAAPASLPARFPGAVVWAEKIPAAPGYGALRVMYHSRDALMRDRAVTGTISYPTGPAPRGGWPVVSWAHGTSGMSSSCAPSRNGAFTESWGLRAVVVATDYVGLGPIGERHPYLSGKAEGYSVIDIVRAARRIPWVHAGRRWVTVGVSQGGHASLFAGELARRYAPELDLAGVVAAAPGSNLTETFPGDTQVVVDVVTVMAVYGLAEDHPQARPENYVSALTASRAKVLDTGCVNEAAIAFGTIPHDQLFKVDPRTTEPARSIAIANDPGHFRSAAPILLVQGTADAIAVPARTEKLRQTLCSLHEPVAQVIVPGGTHDSAIGTAKPQIGAWLADRLARVRAPTSCS
jgi:alpha-beta hydrolase superfamily lysophospholipase